MTLVEVLRRRGIPCRPQGAEVFLCCPFCPDRGETQDTRFRLGVNSESGLGHCFNCGWGSRHAVLALLARLRIQEIVEGSGDGGENREPYREPPRLPEDFQYLAKAEGELETRAKDYLRDRGVLPEQVRRHRLGISLVGRYAYRILFPVREGKLLRGIVARDFTGQQQPKYLNSRGPKYLYGFQSSCPRVILAEGVFKVLRLEQLNTGFYPMGLLGHDLTQHQLEQLQKGGCQEAVIWPDPDRAGMRGACQIAERLSSHLEKVSIVYPLSAPADEMPLEELGRVWAQCLRPYNWRFHKGLYFPDGL